MQFNYGGLFTKIADPFGFYYLFSSVPFSLLEDLLLRNIVICGSLKAREAVAFKFKIRICEY